MADCYTDIPRTYPLSLSQRNIWDVERTCPGTSINYICATLRIHGWVDLPALQRSINLVLASDGSLRTRITMTQDGPVQYQAPFRPEQVPIYDFSSSGQAGTAAWEASYTRESMELLDAPLCRFALLRTGEHDAHLVLKLHHLISDGWTQISLCNRIEQLYLDLLEGKEPIPDEAPSYEVHVEEEQAYLNSAAYRRDKTYWSQMLSQPGEAASLKSVRGASTSQVGNRLSFQLPEDVNNEIYSFCSQHRVSPFTVFYMALAIYLHRTGGGERFTLGVPIFNRPNRTAKQTSGMFVSTLPFTCEISADWSLEEFNRHLGEAWFDLLRHQRFPFRDIQTLGEEAGIRDRLFHIAFSYQNGQLLESRNPSVSFSARWHYSGYQLEQLCIHLNNLEDNRRYAVDYDYLTQLFSVQDIQRLHASLTTLLRAALADPGQPISQLPLLSAENQEQVLHTFNRSARPMLDSRVYDRFLRCVRQDPSRVVLIHNGIRTTYHQLEQQAAQVHAALAACSIPPESLVAVLLPRIPALFGAIMGILRAGGAFLLLPLSLPEQRIREILTQSGASALLTLPEYGAAMADLVPLIHMDQLPAPTSLPPVEIPAEGLAYVVYTSGSTGAPKGVEISRRSLLNLVGAMDSVYGKGAVLSVCSVGFDAFLLESICATLNGRTVLLPRDEDLESPKKLANLICGYGVGFLSTTPSRLLAFLKEPLFRDSISELDTIICGGEAFPSDLLQQLQLATPANIYNQYGPSEATVAVSLKRLNGCNAITVGIPMANCKLYVLDRWGNPLPVGVYGELYVGGICVGRGYRNAPELTELSFSHSPFLHGDRLYRTGDIACWTADGEIMLGGRTDQQVKLRGLRIEPQEVSACLARHPMVRQSAAVVQRHSGQDVLVAFYTAEDPISEDELYTLCASYLPHYMIPSAILRLEAIPLNDHGKVNEQLLPHPDLNAACLARPETQAQALLLSIFRRVLKQTELGIDSDYFLFGGNSLNAMETISHIAEETGCSLRIADLYACRSVRRLASLLEHNGLQTLPATQHLRPAPAQERWPLTPIQQGIYVQSHMDSTGKTYHMAGAFRLGIIPDHQRMEQAFRTLVAEEPLLRTSFVPESEGIFARVSPAVGFILPVVRGGILEEAAAPLLAPFDLTQPPLLRAILWEETSDHWVLLMNTHHIIGDGLTTPVLLQRLDKLYQGQTYPPQSLTYLDYAWHLKQQSDSPSSLRYWKDRLTDLPEPLELPGDKPRSHTFDFLGHTISHTLTQELSEACDDYCARVGVSPYMFFLAAFGLLMSRLSGKEDLVVGAAAAGRLLPETREMCGPFINTLPLRLRPGRDLALTHYLAAVRDEVNGMLDHQQVGLESIVASLGLKRTLSQSPLFQVIFSQRPLDPSVFTLGGAPMEHIPLPTGTARMDLWVELSKENGCYAFHLEYATQLFEEATAAYFGRCLETLATSMVQEENCPLHQLNALSTQDRLELIDVPNNTTRPFLNLPIPDQFAQRLAEDPDAPAVIFHGQTTTRRQLDQRACQIANQLVQAGAKPGCHVGIALSRNVDLVAAVLAIWKAGGAYVPLLAHYPEQRLGYMVDIAGITHILCDDRTSRQLPHTLNCQLVSLTDKGENTFQAVPLQETDHAEVLFTSGSTGRPKGVLMAWRSIANMAESFRELLSQSDGAILCTTNVVFDMFNGEVVVPLSMGKTIVMADEEEMMLPWKLAEIIERDGVTITQSTPSRVQMWCSNEAFRRAAANLDMMMYGGEVVTETLLRQTQAYSNEAIQVNLYGPTEGTVYGTTRAMDYRKHFNVGWPMGNIRAYVLDEQLQPVLPTAVGDLYLAGECVSVGYVNRPDLTEAAYLPDPFCPGQRMYRTGDLGRLRLDGSYDFYGRRDTQVKLNGQRVELDEINGALVSQGCALQAATVPVRREDGSMELFSYYISADSMTDAEIRRRLGAVLPAYMIPSRFLPMRTLPSTPTGKINLRELREMARSGSVDPVMEAPATSPAPASAQEAAVPIPEDAAPGSLDWILTLWCKVLSRTDVKADRSFFEQGGTSLAALSVLSHYHNSGLTLSLAQFYEQPSAAGQASLFSAQQEALPVSTGSSSTEVRTLFTSDDLHQDFPHNVPALPKDSQPMVMDCALLTGATGFLGVHLLRALLDAGVSTVLCAMRDGSRKRLEETLSWYFGQGWVLDHADRIQVYTFDLSAPHLGLSSKARTALLGRVQSIWNCAADVRHYAADSEVLMATNLKGVKELISLAEEGKIPLYHMSTTSVSGRHLVGSSAPCTFEEGNFYVGQDWRENLYVRSKFLAEAAIFQAISAGLTARVFRLGRLVGRTEDGVFQKNCQTNAFWLDLRAIHALGAIPESMAQAPIELTPIDWCAQAAVALRDTDQTVFHLQNPIPDTLESVCRPLVPGLKILSQEQFQQRLAQASATLRSGILAPLTDLLTQQANSPVTIQVDNRLTMDRLAQAGFFQPIPGPDRLLRGFRFDSSEQLREGSDRLDL